ncbi:MAG TPA: hypothetical protein VMM55_06675 [Thermohalobaculum sp.]|nr:hypothetical protein [Thermohalobaculum sp.]
MKTRLALLLALALPAAGAVGADTIVPPDEFLAYAEGYTLTFEQDGEFAGAERFGPDGAVTWQTPEGVCLDGLMRAYDERLCFYYGVSDVVQCWHVLRDEQGLKVQSLGDGPGEPGLTYRITGRSRQPLSCGGPERETRVGPDEPLSPPVPRPARW